MLAIDTLELALDPIAVGLIVSIRGLLFFHIIVKLMTHIVDCLSGVFHHTDRSGSSYVRIVEHRSYLFLGMAQAGFDIEYEASVQAFDRILLAVSVYLSKIG